MKIGEAEPTLKYSGMLRESKIVTCHQLSTSNLQGILPYSDRGSLFKRNIVFDFPILIGLGCVLKNPTKPNKRPTLEKVFFYCRSKEHLFK